MPELSEIVSKGVHWVVVPGILVAVFLFSITVVGRTKKGSAKTSASAGFWAGLIIFVIYVASQLGRITEPSFNFTDLPSLEVAPMGIGLVLGFTFLWGVRYIGPTPMVGLLSLVLSATSLSALYSYVFVESLRSTMLFLTLGAALGALLHVVFFPDSIRSVWE